MVDSVAQPQMDTQPIEDLAAYKQALGAEILPQLRFYPDFPKPGVNFLDIFSATSSPVVFKRLMEALKRLIITKYGAPESGNYTHIVGLESKGFVLGPILSLEFGMPFVAIRKRGKLPGECWQQSYTLEYGADTIEI